MGDKGYFPGGSLGVFSKIFPGGPKVVKFFFLLKTKKTTFFANNLKFLPPSSDAHVCLNLGRT